MYFDSGKTLMMTRKTGTSQVNNKNKERFPWKNEIPKGNCYQDTVGQMGFMYIKKQMLNLLLLQEFQPLWSDPCKIQASY